MLIRLYIIDAVNIKIKNLNKEDCRPFIVIKLGEMIIKVFFIKYITLTHFIKG